MKGARSYRDAAQSIGVTHTTIMEWVRREDCPIRHKPPFTADEIRQLRVFRWTLQEDRAANNRSPNLKDAKTQVEILLARERMEHERLKKEILAGQKIDRELLDASLGGLTAVFIDVLADLEITLPGRMANKTAPQIERDLGPLLDAYRRRLVEKAQYELVTVERMAQQDAEARGIGSGRRGRRGSKS